MPDRPSRTRRALRWLAITLVSLGGLAGIGLLALSHYIDRDRIVSLVATEVKKATGRDLHVDGEIGFHLRPTLVLQLDGLRLSNSAWGTQPDMLKARHLELEVALRPLLDRRLEVRRVLLDGVEVWLETNAQGEGNWVMQGDPLAAAPVAAPDAPAQPLVIDLARLDIRASNLSFRDGRSGTVESLDLLQVALTDSSPQQDGLDAQLRFRGQALGLKGTTSKFKALLAGGDRLSFDLTLALDGSQFQAKGEVGAGSRSGSATLALAAEIQKTDALAALAGMATDSLVLPLPLVFSGQVEQAGAITAVPAFKLVVAGQALTGQVRFDAAPAPVAGKVPAKPQLAITLQADSLNLAALLPAAAKPQTTPPAATHNAGAKLFDDDKLVLPALPALDARLDLTIAQLQLPGKPGVSRQSGPTTLSALHAVLVLHDGKVELQPLAFQFAGGQVNASASLQLAADGGPTVKLQAQAQGFAMDQAMALAGQQGLSGGRSDLRLTLAASGASPHQLARGLAGDVRLQVGPLRLAGDLKGFGGDLATRLVEAVNPFYKQDKGSTVQCVALRLPIQGGRIAVDRTIAAQSDKLDVVVAGTIDLGAETVDLAIHPSIKQGFGVGAASLAQLVKLHGSLSHPTVGVDMQGAARGAASIGVAVATGGLSLIGERMLKERRDPNPCASALGAKPGATATEQAKPPAKSAAAANPVKGFTDRVRGLGQR